MKIRGMVTGLLLVLVSFSAGAGATWWWLSDKLSETQIITRGPPAAKAPPLAKAREVAAIDQQGGKVTLKQFIVDGRPTLLSFWAVWCVPCATEAKALARIRREIGPDRLNIVYINIDLVIPSDKSVKWMKDADAADLPTYFVTTDEFMSFIDSKEVALPQAHIYDRTGKPTKSMQGAPSDVDVIYAEIKDSLKNVL